MNTQEQITQILGIEAGADISAVGSKIIEHIKSYCQAVQTKPKEKTAKVEDAAIKKIYEIFFEYSRMWASEEKLKHKKEKDDPSAARLKERAAEVLSDLQQNIINYAQCYLRLHRASGFIHKEMKIFEKASSIDVLKAEKIPWTSDTGMLLQKYRKERKSLKAETDILNAALDVLQEAEPHFVEAEEAINSILNEKKVEENIRPFRTAMRSKDFNKARKSLKVLDDLKPGFAQNKAKFTEGVQTAKDGFLAYIDIIDKGQENLIDAEGKIYLREKEVSMVAKSKSKEIESKSSFIEKYHQSYMDYKNREISHLKDKLLVIGSIESLMTLYIQLMRGLARPITDMKAVREYEHEVIEKVNYLLGGQFQEIHNIENRLERSMKDFVVSIEDYKSAK